ncbi:MAG: gfo/Idh/MocA family oxidoreductase, partial [Eubacteriales bacterium]|nr:gfo/Idh/MocA family oxidoreductase [Eubacteriales bacterium]
YYQPGAGPMMDMGPYYLTALLHLMGPIESIAGATSRGFTQRSVQRPGQQERTIDVDVSTHVAGVVNFHSGAVASIMMSFDVWRAQLPHIEIYGTQGTLSVPDPDRSAGPVKIFTPGDAAFVDIPVDGFAQDSRGIGVADLAYAILNGRQPRAGIDQMYHVLDAMNAFEDSCREGLVYRLRSTAQVPPLLPQNAHEWAQNGD